MSTSKKRLEASQHRVEEQEGNFGGWVTLIKLKNVKKKKKKKPKVVVEPRTKKSNTDGE